MKKDFSTGSLFVEGVRVDERFARRARSSSVFRFQLVAKRAFDILGSALLLLLLCPVLAVAMLAVRLGSRGPVIFSQVRWGYLQTRFRCFKIRSMYSDRPDLNAVAPGLPKGILLKLKKDPRVTPAGAILRKSSIDELPQLFNVLLGDMSLVGPRPLMLHMLEPFPELREVRSVVRPGITGLWQIRNRAYNTSALDMLKDDCEYIAAWSFLLDLKILLATPMAVLRGSGAH